jgi:signal transduction histidine kinase
MEKLLDKLIILFCCGIFLYSGEITIYTVVPLITALIFSSINIAFNLPSIHISTYIIYLILCFFYPELICFIPLICYDLFCEAYKHVSAAAIIVMYYHMDNFKFEFLLWIISLSILTYILKKRTMALLKIRANYNMNRDEMNEKWLKINYLNKELLEKQDYEVTNATLNERNRIAREIHDTVGHLLSSSILQIGALIAISKDEVTKNSLNQINTTLKTGMDSIRHSIHDIHEDSLDLYSKSKEIIDDFDFCKINFKYTISNELSIKAKYSIIFILKEALCNISKHSNCTIVNVIFLELPGFYRFIIDDNGNVKNSINSSSDGMGLTSICDRINSLGGTISITNNDGFRIFITLFKEKRD